MSVNKPPKSLSKRWERFRNIPISSGNKLTMANISRMIAELPTGPVMTKEELDEYKSLKKEWAGKLKDDFPDDDGVSLSHKLR